MRLLGLLTIICIFSFSLQGQDSQGSAAQGATQTWLALVDAGNYSASWDNAAAFFKKAITREKWQMALEATRTPLGKVKSRTLKSATATKTLPGVPDGEYFVLQFDSSFEQKQTALETVTAIHEPDGSWRVGGYFIR